MRNDQDSIVSYKYRFRRLDNTENGGICSSLIISILKPRISSLKSIFREKLNISALGGVHTLDLKGCKDIIDVSALGEVN